MAHESPVLRLAVLRPPALRPAALRPAARPEARADAVGTFVRHALRCIATTDHHELTSGSLVLPLALSSWVARSGLTWAGAASALLEVRAALIHAHGIDIDTEPVPLLTGDPRQGLWNVAVYLWHLLERIALATGTSPSRLAGQAADEVADDVRSALHHPRG